MDFIKATHNTREIEGFVETHLCKLVCDNSIALTTGLNRHYAGDTLYNKIIIQEPISSHSGSCMICRIFGRVSCGQSVLYGPCTMSHSGRLGSIYLAYLIRGKPERHGLTALALRLGRRQLCPSPQSSGGHNLCRNRHLL